MDFEQKLSAVLGIPLDEIKERVKEHDAVFGADLEFLKLIANKSKNNGEFIKHVNAFYANFLVKIPLKDRFRVIEPVLEIVLTGQFENIQRKLNKFEDKNGKKKITRP